MAYVNTSGFSQGTLLARLMAAVGTIGAMLRQRQVYLATLRELNSLTDRDLADLGLHRASLADIAYEAAYGTK